MLVFIRHVGEVFGIDVGRVRHDQVETLARQTIKSITLHGVDPLINAVTLDILVGHFQRFERQIREHDLGALELVGAGDTDATGTGAQVENPCRLGTQPWRETVFDQLANR
ncbi:hypothetical protein D3C84_843200 [compost metagenome]